MNKMEVIFIWFNYYFEASGKENEKKNSGKRANKVK